MTQSISVSDRISGILAKASDILKGEPARAIGYGAAAVIYLVAKFSGAIPDQSPEAALTLAVGYVGVVASVIESIRHFVSPAV